MKELTKGSLIAVEGIDGTGKTTIVSSIVTFLISEGYQAISFKEPTNETDAGKKIRQSYIEGRRPVDEEIDWFIEDRTWNVEKNILPYLEKKYIVILDRYFYSTACYQGARKQNDWKNILTINRSLFPEPNLVLIIDVRPKVALKRIVKERLKGNTFERLKSLTVVRELFLEMVENDKLGNYLVLNGEKPLEKVVNETILLIKDFLETIQ